jgi:hypothetical protein
LALSTGSTFTQPAAGTLNVTVAAGGGSFGIAGGGGSVSLAGTLGVTTVGNPAVGSAFVVISAGARTGTFATVSSGATNYSVAYGATTVTLTRQP